MMRSRSVVLAALSMLVALTALAPPAPAEKRLSVYVVNYPLQYFTERIGGSQVEVVFPASGGADPAYWMPDRETVAAYQQADLIVLNGANYAKWIDKVSLPQAKLVDSSSTFRERYITSDEVTTHSHGPEGEHAHESLAFTTWLDLDLAARQADQVAAALGRRMPAKKARFEKNLEDLKGELLALDARLQEMAAKAPAKPLVCSHPVYDYLARRYGLNMRSVHWEPDEAPGLGEWLELKAILKEHPASWMVWEGEPLPAVSKALENMGVKSLVFNPAGNVPASGGFLDVMRRNIDNLEAAYR